MVLCGLADEGSAVAAEGDPGGDAELEHGLGLAGGGVAGDAGVGVAQIDDDHLYGRRVPDLIPREARVHVHIREMMIRNLLEPRRRGKQADERQQYLKSSRRQQPSRATTDR